MIISSAITASILLSLTSAHAQEAALNLTLKEAVKMAVERNLDVKAELYNPAMAEADIGKSRGIYDTNLSLQTDYAGSTTQPSSSFLSGGDVIRQRTFSFNAGLNQLIPLGGTVGLTFDNTRNSNNSSVTLNRYYQTELALTYSQPLLKNFGHEATNLDISVAVFAKEASLDAFRTKLAATVATVRNEYFELYSLREELEAKKSSLELARKILSDTQARVKAGVLPAMEITNAEFGVASREKELIDAERALADEMDAIRLLLQTGPSGDFIPVDTPSREPLEVNEQEAIRKGIAARPELLEQRENLKASELQARVAHNRALPDLTFTASGGIAGLNHEYAEAFDKMTSFNYPAWSMGLQFSYPLENRSAVNELIKSRLKVEQAKTRIGSLEQSVVNEVRAAVRAVGSSYKQLGVADRGRAYADEVMQAYLKKQQVGLATTKDVLDVLNNLVAARSSQTQAIANYNNAITQLWKVTGELLDREGITLNGKEADALYREMNL
ncbi:MAG: TolC family protein [Geobacter sp.]|nr:TolC family protein [Geobacter sp.]